MDLVERGFIESLFPGLKGTDWEQTSPADPAYNCAAWAGQDTGRWWWPTAHWPTGGGKTESLESFVRAYETLGYRSVKTSGLEAGIEKIAIYRKDLIPSHVARQLATGQWTSKLGAFVDIRHDLTAIGGERYGRVVQVMARIAPAT